MRAAEHVPMCPVATWTFEQHLRAQPRCECTLIAEVCGGERKVIAQWLRERAKDAMVSARAAASHEAWVTAAGFRVQANTLREIASELEEM